MQPFNYVKPTRLREVIGLLKEHGASVRLLAGGTDLTVGLRHGEIAPRMVIDVKRTVDLPPTISQADGWLTISATAVLSDVLRHEAVRLHFPALAESVGVVGSIQIRNRATLVGNICNASPAADTVPVLVVHGAAVTLLGPRGERQVPVVDFIKGNRHTALELGELVTAVRIPIATQPLGTAFARITRRRGVDLATVNLCCSVDIGGTTTFAFGAVAPRPLRVRDAGGILADLTATAEAKSIALDALISKASPITDLRASAEYRLAMLRVLAERAHHRATQRLADRMRHG